jgi:Tfp pilus assembly protein FimT
MRNVILLMLVVPLMTALTAQQVVASEHHHVRAKARAVAIKQFRNSNAYVAPTDIAVQPYWSGYDGALGAGVAGH